MFLLKCEVNFVDILLNRFLGSDQSNNLGVHSIRAFDSSEFFLKEEDLFGDVGSVILDEVKEFDGLNPY